MPEDKYKNTRFDGRALYFVCTCLMIAEMYFIQTAQSLMLGIPVMLAHAGHRNHVVNGKSE